MVRTNRGRGENLGRRLAAAGAALVLVLVGLARVGHAQATFTGIGTLPGGETSSAAGVSGDGGVVVGNSGTGTGLFEAIRWTAAGGLEALGILSSTIPISRAAAASADGAVVVGESASGDDPSSAPIEAFRWMESGGMVGLGFLPGGGSSQAHGVSADGAVVVGSGGLGGSFGDAFRWTEAGGMASLGALTRSADDASADGSVVVGRLERPEAFRWTQAGGIEHLGFLAHGPTNPAPTSAATGVSADGSVVVGWSSTSSGFARQAFRWTAANGMISLGHLPESPPVANSRALDVSSDGAIVVGTAGAFPAGGGVEFFRAFLWDATNGMRNLADVLAQTGADVAGWELDSANAVSADGRVIVGDGVNPDGRSEGWVAVLAAPACSNGLDDDGDGLVDHPDDPGCVSPLDASEQPECSDAIDNDGDGLVDFPQDSGCATPDGPREGGECMDGIDNDGDGAIDMADVGCGAPNDASEHAPQLVCDNGLDDDGDGLIDFPNDPGCPFPYAEPENPPCDDGIDNDGDGAVDFADSLCEAHWPYWEAPPPASAFQPPAVCGIGAELAVVLPLLRALYGRPRRKGATVIKP